MIRRKWKFAMAALGLIAIGLGVWLFPWPMGVPIAVEGAVDLGNLFAESDDDPNLDVGIGLVRLEGQEAKEFGAILTGGRATADRSGSVTGGCVTLRFADGKEDQVYLSRPPVVASFRWRHRVGFWYITEEPSRFIALDLERLRDLLRPCLEETRQKQKERQNLSTASR